MGYFVHETSVVDEGAVIGEGTRIWHFSHVMGGARIGRNCRIGQNVFVGDDVVVGDTVKIQNNVSLYTGVTVADGVFVGPSVVFTNVVNPRSEVPRRDEYRPTMVGRGATIGANATVVCGVVLGRYCFVGAGAVVTRDVPDFGLAFGLPASVQGWVCRCGVKLALSVVPRQEQATCIACGDGYVMDEAGVRPRKENR